MMSLWDALRMNMMISYQELVRTFHKTPHPPQEKLIAGLTEAIAAQTKSKFKNEN